MFTAIDALEYPELHDESIPFMAFLKQLTKLMSAAGVRDFTMQARTQTRSPTQFLISALPDVCSSGGSAYSFDSSYLPSLNSSYLPSLNSNGNRHAQNVALWACRTFASQTRPGCGVT